MEKKEINENIKQVICKKVKKYRNEKKINLMELSEELGITPDHLKRIESKNGRNNISLMTLYKISVLLDVSIEKFFKD